MTSRILILDFGSQYTQLIARRIRESNIYCEIYPCFTPLEKIKTFKPNALILSGGPSSVTDKEAPQADTGIFDLNIPILGICYGLQWMAQILKGKVHATGQREYGKATIDIQETETLFKGILDPSLQVWMSHGDQLETLPPSFVTLASTATCPHAAVRSKDNHYYGVQFHPEVMHTHRGTDILNNFLFDICKVKKDWTMKSFIEAKVEEIRQTVGEGHVLCAVSGGVDSTVAAALVHRAVGDRLHAVFVDNGLLRLNEADHVQAMFEEHVEMKVHCVRAQDQFLNKLAGVEDPEKKRKIIGNEFIEVFQEEAKKFKQLDYLMQGTLYPDVIESVSFSGGPSVTIKSHHNVGGLPESMHLKLIEPLRELFKDEVRLLGKALGLPDRLIQRQPFPGPGLAVRILGAVTQERIDILQAADGIVVGEIKAAGYYHKVWQSFGVLLPIKTVGVMGDARTYENVLAIRAVDSRDGMTADWVPLPYDLLGRISNRIINEVKGINRVVYDISSKPPSTIEWE
jgi:GMP synthase (glutamine-hydrolysing)